MKTFFKNMPIEITNDEFLILANTLYASFSAMISKNDMIYLINTKDKKVYGFDSITEIEKIKNFAAKENNHLLQIIN